MRYENLNRCSGLLESSGISALMILTLCRPIGVFGDRPVAFAAGGDLPALRGPFSRARAIAASFGFSYGTGRSSREHSPASQLCKCFHHFFSVAVVSEWAAQAE